jgi:uncharacterized NAD(P)/FAD-binding protein YdhS
MCWKIVDIKTSSTIEGEKVTINMDIEYLHKFEITEEVEEQIKKKAEEDYIRLLRSRVDLILEDADGNKELIYSKIPLIKLYRDPNA